MPPRKGIVKSGNAGNSSKSGKEPTASGQTPEASEEKSLFPPGSKWPSSLLQERCQKNGWEKPIIDTRKHANGWSFIITLSRINKKTSEKESVRLEPHPPYFCPSPLHARHWGATYGLHRFCNGLQLNRVLPRGPAEYWNDLAAEHKQVPEHMKWMYEADPFAARKQVNERQARAAEKHAQKTVESSSGNTRKSNLPVTSEFSQAPEVRMAAALRDQVEEAVKQGLAMYSRGVKGSEPLVIPANDVQNVMQQLIRLGFNSQNARSAIEFLSKPSPIADKLLDALPERFLPSVNSSNPFITGTHSGSDDLKARWTAERAIKEAGWPVYVVKELTADARYTDDWDLLMAALGKKLIGDDSPTSKDTTSDGECFQIDTEEAEAFGGHFEGAHHLAMPMFSASATLHVMVSSDGSYPCRTFSPMYITGQSIPAYLRLHLLSCLLLAVQDSDFLGDGEGFCTAAMRCLEAAWAEIEDNGPPDISDVLKNVLPVRPSTPPPEILASTTATEKNQSKSGKRTRRKDTRSNEQIKADFDKICQNEKYREILSGRQKLPSFTVKAQFLNLLESNQVVVVVGETGCGKTTQLPQFILDAMIESHQGSSASILVTQPRRLSAIGVASRVSTERLDDGSVGYAIRGENSHSMNTKLLFCTTGIVLRRLSLGDKLEDVSHIVVDEVHERSVDSDFLLLELKELLKHHSRLKVVLIYLEDFIQELDYRPSAGKKTTNKSQEDALSSQGLDEKTISAIQTITRSEQCRLPAALVSHVVATSHKRGGILIFLPGVQEIRQCMDILLGTLDRNDTEILPLHANLSSAEQMRVFAKTSKWKVIAATNVAETSITIDDVIYVVDAGKVKEVQYDSEANFSKIAAARQRRGRAGRTQPGTCYKIYTRKQEENMAKYSVPEILRVPLENISLAVKVTREDVDQYLARALSPPNVNALDTAWSILGELGAVTEQGKLTSLGRHISMLPIDLRLAKMLILGTIFRCLSPILTITACLSSKPLFFSPIDKREEANQARLRFMMGNSDLLTDMNAYDECLRVPDCIGGKPIRVDLEQNFISTATVREISTLRRDYLGPLAAIGFIPLNSTPNSPDLNVNSSNENLLKSIILGGLWPRSAIKFDKVQGGTVQRENTAKEFKFFDLREGRVFLHPSSVLFGHASWKSAKAMTTKMFLRDATEVPIWAILLFGGPVSINHVGGGLKISTRDSHIVLKSWPRIGILVNHIRELLEAKLQQCVEDGAMLNEGDNSPVIAAILALLTNDGMSGR
ncbi:P-loop containing nucleoside triphosphate hydrolase protein [Gymnopus androsaceus JB14]|uniref:RNA helicase n=1 Tax=Gymnopus androsaceus JB14 TaxID=1447944 RepID=A0A6A4IGK6_9AGAR|nr:P-loop containing nucleoside triphosphate hydrolase protein [Gymnopus androsaceus JB14]